MSYDDYPVISERNERKRGACNDAAGWRTSAQSMGIPASLNRFSRREGREAERLPRPLQVLEFDTVIWPHRSES